MRFLTATIRSPDKIKAEAEWVKSVNVTEKYESQADKTSFVSLLITDGNGVISCGAESLSVKKGDSLFLTADSGAFSVNGMLELVETRI